MSNFNKQTKLNYIITFFPQVKLIYANNDDFPLPDSPPTNNIPLLLLFSLFPL